jgi:hypothetical protein
LGREKRTVVMGEEGNTFVNQEEEDIEEFYVLM